MASKFHLKFLHKTPVLPSDNPPLCIWTYHLSWQGDLPADTSKIGLQLPSDVPIDNAAQPQGTSLTRDPLNKTQYVTKEPPTDGSKSLEISFIAPESTNSNQQFGLALQDESTQTWDPIMFATKSGSPEALKQNLPGPTAAPEMNKLTNSARRVPKATLVSIQIPRRGRDIGGAITKFGFVSNLRLQPTEVDSARRHLERTDFTEQTWNVLKAFEGSPTPASLPSPALFAAIPQQDLSNFGKAIVAVRQSHLDQVRLNDRPFSEREAAAINIHNAGLVAVNAFEANFKVSPIGVLNLERIEMTPVGVQRGALLATIPLAPLEQTAVTHKEWSVTTKEFTSIVTDSLENYSETGVTENTELAQATTSQNSHSSQFNVNGTVTGRYGPVTATVSSGFTTQGQESQSANESRKHAVATTRSASSRVKQEHKVSISTSTVTGTSESSTRMLQNPSETDPMRIDYFSLMRKWHVGLYRYGLRLTYDIAIPEPASAIRRQYAELENLRSQLGPFQFSVPRETITSLNYKSLADQYNAQVPVLPAATYTTSVAPEIGICPDKNSACGVIFSSVPLPTIKDGYEIDTITLDGGIWGYSGIGSGYGVVGTQFFKWDAQGDQEFSTTLLLDTAGNPFLKGAQGSQTIGVFMNDVRSALFVLTIQAKLTTEALEAWQLDVWNALCNAAQTQYFGRQQEIQSKVDALEAELKDVDTLTLRREENEEVMKGVLKWLLGPNFHFMPEDVLDQFIQQAATPQSPQGNIDLVHGTVLDATRGDGLDVTAQGWYPMFAYQEMVKFINEAIEWENVLYFLYGYFWDVPPSWNFVRRLRHPDSTRQAFLRSGSARVVLTVRRGWEEAWVNFVEAGGFGEKLIPDHPYMTIAHEVQNYDETNYPGIPPANPAGGPLPDDGESVSSVSSDVLTPSNGAPVTIAVKSSTGFHVGYTAVLDAFDTKITQNGVSNTAQEAQVILDIPDDFHITVERVENPHDGSIRPFPVMQAGEKGQLIAEWFEYTPTSGTDIAVTSDLSTMA